jgi:hypothetical protein
MVTFSGRRTGDCALGPLVGACGIPLYRFWCIVVHSHPTRQWRWSECRQSRDQASNPHCDLRTCMQVRRPDCWRCCRQRECYCRSGDASCDGGVGLTWAWALEPGHLARTCRRHRRSEVARRSLLANFATNEPSTASVCVRIPMSGLNWQLGPRWVIGIEGDGGFGNRTATLAGFPFAPGPAGTVEAADKLAVKTAWDASLRGRLGFLFLPVTLAYVTCNIGLCDRWRRLAELRSEFDVCEHQLLRV